MKKDFIKTKAPQKAIKMVKEKPQELWVCTYLNETDFNYLKKVKSLGIKKVFTTLHKSEVSEAKEVVIKWIKDIQKMGFELIIDISRSTLSIISLQEFKKLGIKSLRIDDGFSDEEIMDIQKMGFDTILNASNVHQGQIDKLTKAGINKKKTLWMHNFYPKPETGLSKDFCSDKARLLYRNGFENIGGFISSSKQKRGPMFLGLPTLEETRFLDEYEAFLIAKNYFDLIAVGDQTADIEKLKKIQNISYKDKWDVEIKFISKEVEKNFAPHILNKYYTIRPDLGASMIRLYESRVTPVPDKLLERGTIANKVRGAITIDNKNYAKYKAEIDIMLGKGKNHKGTFILGHVVNLEVLDLIKGGNQIKLINFKKS